MKINKIKIVCGLIAVIMIIFGTLQEGYKWNKCGSAVKVQAAEADENGFIIEDGVMIEYTGEGGEVKTKIENGVLTKYTGEGGNVKIPNGVTSIGNFAFHECKNLEKVEIPNSVINIGDDAFGKCSNLKQITLSDNLVSIGAFAFESCKSLEQIEIPDNVVSIEMSAFVDCDQLKEIIISNDNQNYAFVDGALFNKDMTTLIQYPSEIESYKIPNSVINIGDGAFMDCSNLKQIEIPNSVINIGAVTFASCINLKQIEIPNSVESIGFGAFRDCDQLKEIKIADNHPNYTFLDGALFNKDMTTLIQYPAETKTYKIPDGVTRIEIAAFWGCSSLKQIHIPDSVKNIEFDVFWDCSSLEQIKIPDSVVSIGGWAFSNCSSLKRIDIPNSVIDIGPDTFYGVSKDFTIYCTEGSYAHTYAKEHHLAYVFGTIKSDWSLKKKKLVLKNGQKSKIKFLSKPDNLSFKSKDPSIAAVNSKGVVTGKKKGKTVITVSADEKTAKVKVTIKADSSVIKLSKTFKLSKKSVTLKKGKKLTIQKASGLSGKVIFKSSNAKVASVSVKGVVKAKKKGKAVILIKRSGKTVKLNITVRKK